MDAGGMMSVGEKGRPRCVVMGLGVGGLAVVRSLGRRGIRVVGVDHAVGMVARDSRYCRSLDCPDPRCEESLVEFLKEIASEGDEKPVLLATNDEFVMFVGKNEEGLRDHYLFVLADYGVLLSLNDKRVLCNVARESGVAVPRSFFPGGLSEVEEVGRRINYPCILKPAYGYLYRDVQSKGIVARNFTELVEGWRRFSAVREELILQEFVCGEDDDQYSLGVYLDRGSRVLGSFMGRKMRQNPPKTGVGTLVESCRCEVVGDQGISFLKGLGFRGVAEVEFKTDGRDGRVVLIEVNTRFWSQVGLAAACGVDFAHIAYLDACGRDVEGGRGDTRQGVKWLDFGGDVFACLSRDGYVRSGDLTVSEWLGSVIRARVYGVFALDDLVPFWKAVRVFLREVVRRLRGAVYRKLRGRGKEAVSL